RRRGSSRVDVVPPASAAQSPPAALSEADPHAAGRLQLVTRGRLVGGVLFGPRMRGESAHSDQLGGLLPQDAPERHQLAVEVVDGLHPGRLLGEQDGQAARVGLDVVVVIRQQRGDPRRDALLAAEVRDWASDGRWHGVSSGLWVLTRGSGVRSRTAPRLLGAGRGLTGQVCSGRAVVIAGSGQAARRRIAYTPRRLRRMLASGQVGWSGDGVQARALANSGKRSLTTGRAYQSRGSPLVASIGQVKWVRKS